MAEAKISQLAKLLSAVMEYEDLPVEIHNAIADWSCPGGRVTNSPELFELILEDRKKHRGGLRRHSQDLTPCVPCRRSQACTC